MLIGFCKARLSLASFCLFLWTILALETISLRVRRLQASLFESHIECKSSNFVG